jgi:hypothetical protein
MAKWTGPWNVLRVIESNVQIQLISKPDSDTKWTHLENVKPYLDGYVRGTEIRAGLVTLDTGDRRISDSSGASESETEEENGVVSEDGIDNEPVQTEEQENSSEQKQSTAEPDNTNTQRDNDKPPTQVLRHSHRTRKTTRQPDFIYSSGE